MLTSPRLRRDLFSLSRLRGRAGVGVPDKHSDSRRVPLTRIAPDDRAESTQAHHTRNLSYFSGAQAGESVGTFGHGQFL
jgi:hypothetical protein